MQQVVVRTEEFDLVLGGRRPRGNARRLGGIFDRKRFQVGQRGTIVAGRILLRSPGLRGLGHAELDAAPRALCRLSRAVLGAADFMSVRAQELERHEKISFQDRETETFPIYLTGMAETTDSPSQRGVSALMDAASTSSCRVGQDREASDGPPIQMVGRRSPKASLYHHHGVATRRFTRRPAARLPARRFVMTLIAGLAGKPPPCPRHPGTVPQEAQSVNRHPGMKERQGDNGNALQADTQGA